MSGFGVQGDKRPAKQETGENGGLLLRVSSQLSLLVTTSHIW